MFEAYGTEDKYSDIGMDMLQIASVADCGNIFAESCYTIEGGYIIHQYLICQFISTFFNIICRGFILRH